MSSLKINDEVINPNISVDVINNWQIIKNEKLMKIIKSIMRMNESQQA